MTITVVTARDENGAPSAREVLRGGDSYTIVSGNLEIISSAREMLGFYPSGDWLSVYVGDCVRVNPERSAPEPDGLLGTPRDADVGASDSKTTAITEPGPAEDVVEGAEILARPAPDPHRRPHVGGVGSTPKTNRPPGMRPVVFPARAYQPKEPDPDPPPRHRGMRPVIFPAKAYQPKERDPDPAPHHRWMRPVIFGPRTSAPEPDDPPAPRPDQ